MFLQLLICATGCSWILRFSVKQASVSQSNWTNFHSKNTINLLMIHHYVSISTVVLCNTVILECLKQAFIVWSSCLSIYFSLTGTSCLYLTYYSFIQMGSSAESMPDGFSIKGSQPAYSKNKLRKTIQTCLMM